MFHQVAPEHPRPASVSCGGSLHLAQATLDSRGHAGLRGASATTSLKRSPLSRNPARAGIRANPASLMKHPG
jgi:hypothetical protein